MEVPALWEVPEQAEGEKTTIINLQSLDYTASPSLQPVSHFSLAQSGSNNHWRSIETRYKHAPSPCVGKGPSPTEAGETQATLTMP